ncbi:MAG: hypothetical protein QGG33_04180 [Candidatus Krumholzibacteria bacterium]|nr:hypothetical protein [Candidatus Krumholzibacteria bacterium]
MNEKLVKLGSFALDGWNWSPEEYERGEGWQIWEILRARSKISRLERDKKGVPVDYRQGFHAFMARMDEQGFPDFLECDPEEFVERLPGVQQYKHYNELCCPAEKISALSKKLSAMFCAIDEYEKASGMEDLEGVEIAFSCGSEGQFDVLCDFPEFHKVGALLQNLHVRAFEIKEDDPHDEEERPLSDEEWDELPRRFREAGIGLELDDSSISTMEHSFLDNMPGLYEECDGDVWGASKTYFVRKKHLEKAREYARDYLEKAKRVVEETLYGNGDLTRKEAK